MKLQHAEWLVGTEWLREHGEDPKLRIFDTTARLSIDDTGKTGRDEYELGHIPGAGFLDLAGELSDAESPDPFMRSSPRRLAEVLGAAGIGNEHRVVLYSTSHVMWATRVFWLLRGIGFDRAAVLDGGLARWRDGGHPLCSEPCGGSSSPKTSRSVERGSPLCRRRQSPIQSNSRPRTIPTGSTYVSRSLVQ